MTQAANLAVAGGTVQAPGNFINSGTAVASTSGTSIDFTSIPSWVKRITVMMNGISTNGAGAAFMVQIGSGSITTSGYLSQTGAGTTSSGVASTGLLITGTYGSASFTLSGTMVLTLIGSNTWVATSVAAYTNTTSVCWVGGGNSPALGGALDRVRITTFAGTETFDAGSINILYEG